MTLGVATGRSSGQLSRHQVDTSGAGRVYRDTTLSGNATAVLGDQVLQGHLSAQQLILVVGEDSAHAILNSLPPHERGLPSSINERSGVTHQSDVDDGSGKSVVHSRDGDHAVRSTPSAQPAVPGFSCSVGNTIAVSNVAWQLYKRCKGGPESLCDMSQELQSLHAVLKECGETFSATPMPPQREERLRVIMCGCSEVLEQLQSIASKYESLNQQTKRTWNRMNWHSEDVNEFRSQLTSHISMLTAFMNTSQARVEQKLNDLLREFREGSMEGSVISSLTVDSLSLDERAQWRTVRKELEDHGISLEMFSTNRDFIFQWFADAVANGAFGEDQGDDDEYPSTLSNGNTSESTTGAFEETQVDDNQDYNTCCDRRTSGSSVDTRTEATSLVVRPSPAEQIRQHRPKAPRVALFLARSSRPGEALQEAASAGDVVSVRAIFGDSTRMAPVRPKDLSGALHAAALEGHLDICTLLVKAGAYVDSLNDQRCTPLYNAAACNHLGVCQMLIEAGADVFESNFSRQTSLHPAALSGYTKVCKFLVEAGVDIDKSDISGLTASHLAVLDGHTEVCKVLVEAGANIEKSNKSELTPLHLAVLNGFTKVCKTLVEAGAEVNKRDGRGWTPLSCAVMGDKVELCKCLIEAGADVDGDRKRDRITPLEHAAWYGKPVLCKVLLGAGADVNLSGRFTGGPLEAVSKADGGGPHKGEISRIFKAAGADISKARARYYAASTH